MFRQIDHGLGGHRHGSMKVGGGGRFEELVRELKLKGYSEESARKIAATIGRRKYGAARFARLGRGHPR